MEMTDEDLKAVLLNLVRNHGGYPAGTPLDEGAVLEPGIVRVAVLQRGSSRFVMDRHGNVLEYMLPACDDAEAVRRLKAGTSSRLPEGALAAAGFRES
jgi:hypothetical protein